MKKTKTDNQLVFSHRIDSSANSCCIATHLSSGPGCPSCTRAFSLIELMIVIVILGALTAIIVPMFSYSETNAKEDAVTAEMAAIRKAYLEFYNDNFPEDELSNLANYGLYPLVRQPEPITTPANSYPGTWANAVHSDYDHYNDLGWNGPYLMHEGLQQVRVNIYGQVTTNAGTQCEIPIVKDPYGGYYRVVNAQNDSDKLSLICTGRNLQLDTTDSTTNAYGWVTADTNTTDDVSLPLNLFKRD